MLCQVAVKSISRKSMDQHSKFCGVNLMKFVDCRNCSGYSFLMVTYNDMIFAYIISAFNNSLP